MALRIWRWFLIARRNVNRRPLPLFVREFGAGPLRNTESLSPHYLSRAVDKALRLGGEEPTCLVKSLVLFRLLREQGDPAELVIGLPPDAKDHIAHAWVELDGTDLGPAPGRGRHVAIARFG
ncbi:MAG TPA: lasso peptide biosynthesis B2 protein [bacterium]|nr:lasso peptide biosynthesis B2 protein [bacterium]